MGPPGGKSVWTQSNVGFAEQEEVFLQVFPDLYERLPILEGSVCVPLFLFHFLPLNVVTFLVRVQLIFSPELSEGSQAF